MRIANEHIRKHGMKINLDKTNLMTMDGTRTCTSQSKQCASLGSTVTDTAK